MHWVNWFDGCDVSVLLQAPDDSNIGLQELDQVLLRAGHPANLMNLPVRKMVNRYAYGCADYQAMAASSHVQEWYCNWR